MQLGFSLELRNPNDEPIKLLLVEYQVAVAGRTVYRGKRSAEATLDRNGRRSMVLPAVVRFDQIASGDPAQMARDVPYRLSGTILYLTPGEIAELLLDSGVRKPKVSFTSSGVMLVDRADG